MRVDGLQWITLPTRALQLCMLLRLLLGTVVSAVTIDISSAKIANPQDFATHPSSVNDTLSIHVDPAPDGLIDSTMIFASVAGTSWPKMVQNFYRKNSSGGLQDAEFDIPECPSGMYVLNLMDPQTWIVITVSPQILISNPGIRTATTNTNFAGATTVSSTTTETVPTTSTSTSTSTMSPSTRRYKTLAIAISSTLGGTFIIILLTGLVLRKRRTSISAATQPFEALPSNTTTSWPPLLRVPAEKVESKFASDAPPQAPILPIPASLQPEEPAQSSQNRDVIARLQEQIRYLEEVRDLDIGQGEQLHPSRGAGTSVDDPPPEYPETTSGVSVSR